MTVQVLEGRIVRYHWVCNRFMKAYVTLEGREEGVYVLVPKVDGYPIYEKGETVAYVEGPLRNYKGHMVRGEVAAWGDVEPEAVEDARNWGLT